MKSEKQLKHEIQTALAELRECESALEKGEASKARDVILKTITRLERLLHDAARARRQT